MATRQKLKQHTAFFEPVLTMIFNLPVQERLEIVEKVREKDWKQDFWKLHEEIGSELKASGLKVKDIPALIENVRREKKSHRS